MIKHGNTKIVLASQNLGKLAEIQAFVPGIVAIDEGFHCEENGDSFLANARLKAQAGAAFCGEHCLADDSGLCVHSLGDEPGIYSARYFRDGWGLQDILERLGDNPDADYRAAKFVCCLFFVDPKGHEIWHTERHWLGSIALRPAGENGFGYDPIFIPHGGRVTAAQLDSDTKNTHSHRARALKDFREFYRQRFMTT